MGQSLRRINVTKQAWPKVKRNNDCVGRGPPFRRSICGPSCISYFEAQHFQFCGSGSRGQLRMCVRVGTPGVGTICGGRERWSEKQLFMPTKSVKLAKRQPEKNIDLPFICKRALSFGVWGIGDPQRGIEALTLTRMQDVFIRDTWQLLLTSNKCWNNVFMWSVVMNHPLSTHPSKMRKWKWSLVWWHMVCDWV
jgi:hypothetical protein